MELVWCNFPSRRRNQFAVRQTRAFCLELSCVEWKPGRLNVMLRALGGDREGDLGVRDKQTSSQLHLSLMISFFFNQSLLNQVLCLCLFMFMFFPNNPIWVGFCLRVWLLNALHGAFQWKTCVNSSQSRECDTECSTLATDHHFLSVSFQRHSYPVFYQFTLK